MEGELTLWIALTSWRELDGKIILSRGYHREGAHYSPGIILEGHHGRDQGAHYLEGAPQSDSFYGGGAHALEREPWGD